MMATINFILYLANSYTLLILLNDNVIRIIHRSSFLLGLSGIHCHHFSNCQIFLLFSCVSQSKVFSNNTVHAPRIVVTLWTAAYTLTAPPWTAAYTLTAPPPPCTYWAPLSLFELEGSPLEMKNIVTPGNENHDRTVILYNSSRQKTINLLKVINVHLL